MRSKLGIVAAQEANGTEQGRASQRVANALETEIREGHLSVGTRLPYRQLAARHGVAVNTAIAAVRLLRDRGLVEIKGNSGARVRDRSADVDPHLEIQALRTAVEALRTDLQRAQDTVTKVSSGLDDIANRLVDLGNRESK